VATAADALTQLETLDYYRVQHGLSPRELREQIRVGLRQLLT
jgi:hypothetical protein